MNTRFNKHIGFTSPLLHEKSKEHLKRQTSVSNHIRNCSIYKNYNTVLISLAYKKRKNKFQKHINEAILLKRFISILN